MKTLSTISAYCFFVLLLFLSCDNENGTIPEVLHEKAVTDHGVRVTSASKEEIVKKMSDLLILIKDNIDRTGSGSLKLVSEQTLIKLKNADSDDEIKIAVAEMSSNSVVILNSCRELQRLSQIAKENRLDTKEISKLISKRIVYKSQQRYFSRTRINLKSDCMGLCSQQFNIDIEVCDNDLALQLGMGILLGEFSGGLLGSAAFIYAIASYSNCENASFFSHDTCVNNCPF